MGTLRLPIWGPKGPQLVAEGHQPSAGARSLAPVGGKIIYFLKMPSHCVVMGRCSYPDKEIYITLFGYPRDPVLKQKWTKAIQSTRDNFNEPDTDKNVQVLVFVALLLCDNVTM